MNKEKLLKYRQKRGGEQIKQREYKKIHREVEEISKKKMKLMEKLSFDPHEKSKTND